jgi:hypothetical protein
MVIWVEISSFRDFMTEGRSIIISSKDIVYETSVSRIMFNTSR